MLRAEPFFVRESVLLRNAGGETSRVVETICSLSLVGAFFTFFVPLMASSAKCLFLFTIRIGLLLLVSSRVSTAVSESSMRCFFREGSDSVVTGLVDLNTTSFAKVTVETLMPG